MKKLSLLTVATSTLAISACGSSTGDRALSGAGIGAATGAVGSAIVGGSVAGGALVGAGVGAAVGAATDEDDINFDR